MIIGTIHTVYSGRGGIDFFFERIVKEMLMLFPDISFRVFCNKEAMTGLPGNQRLAHVYIKALDNQYTKVVWLEYFSRGVINKKNIDLFWIPSGTNSFPAVWDVPVVTTIHDIGECHLKSKYGFIRMMYRKKICIPRSLERSAQVVTPSCFTSSDIKENLGYEKNITVIYEAADPWFDEAVRKPDLETNEGTLSRRKGEFILCVGRINYYAKGIDTILKGYRAVAKEKKTVLPLVFVGPKGEGWRRLGRFIKEHKLQGAVSYVGEVSPSFLQQLYEQSALVINASRYEGFGIPLLESMKRGKPLLCSDLKTFKEIALDAPLFFKCGDDVDFSTRLRAFLDGRIDLGKHIARGKEIARLYSWEKAARGYQAVFNSVHNR